MANAENCAGEASALVWDLDGTLVDSAGDIALALNQLLQAHSLPAQSLCAVTGMIGAGVGALIQRGFARAGRTLTPSQAAAMQSTFQSGYAQVSGTHTRLYPGVADTLAQLSEAGFAHAICTNKPHRITLQVLQQVGIAECFKVVIGGDSTAAMKPDPLPLDTCVREMGSSARRAIMIGDSAADIAAARALAMRSIVVRGGYCGVPVESLGADAVVDAVAQIPQRLTRLGVAA